MVWGNGYYSLRRRYMSKQKISWTTDKEKFEAIGFLARPGVVDRISAQVQSKYVNRFKTRFAGKYMPEYPYDVGNNKRGYQYRIDINYIEGCPVELLGYITGKYALRLENNDFIRDLVDNYGFIFTNGEQNSANIYNIMSAIGGAEFEWFKNAYHINARFIGSLKDKTKTFDLKVKIVDENIEAKKVSKTSGKKGTNSAKSTFSDEELMNLGWIGELCVYKALVEKNEDILKKLNIDSATDYVVTWYNDGYQKDENWEDKSVGKGCDLEVSVGNRKIFIEVKSSKRKSGVFTMTTSELVKMKDAGEEYYLVKVNNLEKILKDEPIDIQIFDYPYDKFFKPERIKTATFRLGGNLDE